MNAINVHSKSMGQPLGTLCTSQYSQTPVYQIPATMGAHANNWRSPTCVCVLTTGKEGTAHNV